MYRNLENLAAFYPEAAKEFDELVSIQKDHSRLLSVLGWIESHARTGKIEIAKSLYGTGFEFGFWPGGSCKVVNSKSLKEAVEKVSEESLFMTMNNQPNPPK